MKASHTVIAALLSLVLGGAVGWTVAKRRFEAALSESVIWHSAASADIVLTALKRLRRGDTNAAVRSLEIRLDGEIAILQAMLADIPESHRRTIVVHVLEEAQAYRASHPTDPSGIENKK